MLAVAPVDVAPLTCEVRPYTATLYADAAKKRPVPLPPGTISRKCSAPYEGWRIITKPDSGGTEMCVIYEFGVDPNKPDVQATLRRTGVSRSLPDKSCAPLDYGQQSYPGKEWFFLGDNVPLPNAFAIKAKVESEGLAYLNAEKQKSKDARPATDFGKVPLTVFSIYAAPAGECRKNATFFQGRYAACYRVEFYNKNVRGGWSLLLALNTKREYQFIESTRSAVPKLVTNKMAW